MNEFWQRRLAVVTGGAAVLMAGATPLLAAPEEQAEMPMLIQWAPGEFIWTIILFLILLAVLVKWVWPPILKGLKDREDKIRNDLEEAEKARKEAAESLEQYKAQLAESRREAHQIIEQSRSEAQKLAQEIKSQAQTDIDQMRTRAQRDIRAAREEAIADLYARTAEVATHIAARILEREISADDQKALIDRALNELSSAEGTGLEPSVSTQA